MLCGILEGEKDVAKLETAGVVATTPPGGAGKWRSTYAEQASGLQLGNNRRRRR